jgi:hypothetical protein
MSYELIKFKMFSLRDFESESFAAAVLKEIWASEECFIPKRFGLYKMNGKVEGNDFSELIKLWMNSENNSLNDNCSQGKLFAERKGSNSVIYSMSWKKSNNYSFNTFSITASIKLLSNENKLKSFMNICYKLAPLIEPVYGEMSNWSFPEALTAIDLMVRIPELNYMVIFGKPYIELFGKDKLLNTPCFKVNEITEDIISLQLSDSVFNPVEDSVRTEVKEYLGKDCFVENGKIAHDYRDGTFEEDGKLYPKYRDGITPVFDFTNTTYDKNKPLRDYDILRRDTTKPKKPTYTLETNGSFYKHDEIKYHSFENCLNNFTTTDWDFITLTPSEPIKNCTFLQVGSPAENTNFKYTLETAFNAPRSGLKMYRYYTADKGEVLNMLLKFFYRQEIPDYKNWTDVSNEMN